MSISNTACAALVTSGFGSCEEKPLSFDEFYKLLELSEQKQIEITENTPLWRIVDCCGSSSLSPERVFKIISAHFEDIRDMQIISTNSALYPKKLFKLKKNAPPVLFAIGHTALLQNDALAVTGSRNAKATAVEFAKDIGEVIASENKTIVSGGARGCDFAATKSAIENGGTGVWFVAVSFSECLKNRLVREWVEAGRLCIACDFNPNEGFERTKALRRNPYIYAFAEASFVCECKSTISGTFSGASKCIKQKLSKLYVFDTKEQGGKKLIEMGGIAVSCE